LAQAEVLFLSFKGLVEDLDKEEARKMNESAPGLRRRKGTEEVETKRGISEDLRDSLLCWTDPVAVEQT